MKPVSLLPALFFVVCFSLQPHTYADDILTSNIFNLRAPSENIYASGQPTVEQLELLAKNGMQHVINIRGVSELDWDEAEKVSALGMTYHALPISGKNDVSFVNASKLDTLLNSLNSEPSILHCGSSNRVGALIALQEFKTNGGNSEAAVKKGRAWGLTKLEPHVLDLMKSEKNN